MSGVVIGMIGALAVAAVGAGLKWGKAALAAVMRRVRPDHRTLTRAPGLGAGRFWGIRQPLGCARPGGLRAEPVAAPRQHRSRSGDPVHPFELSGHVS